MQFKNKNRIKFNNILNKNAFTSTFSAIEQQCKEENIICQWKTEEDFIQDAIQYIKIHLKKDINEYVEATSIPSKLSTTPLEVMIECKKYYAIENNTLQTLKRKLK